MDLISKRKHTPIVSEKQRGLFGAEIARKKRIKREDWHVRRDFS